MMRPCIVAVVVAVLFITSLASAQAGCGSGGDCFTVHAAGGFNTSSCCAAVCSIDPYCCDVEWDASCVEIASYTCAQSENPCPADVDGDGMVDIGDLLGVINNWNQAYSPYDIAHGGIIEPIVDVNDLL